MKKYLKLLLILLIAAINFNIFLKPMKLVTGGTQGLAIIIHELIYMPHSTIVLIINLLMLILSYIFLKKETTLGTVIATISYPLFIKLTSFFDLNISTNLLNVIITGIISGLTNGYIYKLCFTSCVINTISPIINKYKNIKLGTINLIINIIILLIEYLQFWFKKLLYSIVVIIINLILINLVMYVRFLKRKQ